MTRNRRLKKLKNKEIADSLLAEQYTLEDLLDPKAHWDMVNMSEEQKKEYMQLKQIELVYRNLAPCILVAQEKLNGLNTFQNAEKIGLTKDMTDEQKEMLRDLSKDVDLSRILSISRKWCKVILMSAIPVHFILKMYFNNFYNSIQPGEKCVLWGMIFSSIYLYFVDRKIGKNISERIYFIAKAYEKNS